MLLAPAIQMVAQGGPPFRTDDPETPGNKHWEINFGLLGSRNPQGGNYQTPDLDINYGLGDRIQLRYELPFAITESRPIPATASQPAEPGHVLGGLGESLLGIKMLFYEHRMPVKSIGNNGKPQSGEQTPEVRTNFNMSIYPQLTLDNPTRSVSRGVVPPGPDFLLPLEANARIGPLRIDGEVGCHFGNHALAQSWIRGLVVGHEFSDRTEAYVEIYDQQDANRVPSVKSTGQVAELGPKQRQTTLGIGGRQAFNKQKSLVLLLMGGRSFQTVTAYNDQPSWIAYIGLRINLGAK